MLDLLNPIHLLLIASFIVAIYCVAEPIRHFINYVRENNKHLAKEQADRMIQFEKDAMEHRGCHYCKHCQPAVTWSCRNREAIKARGTNIPDVKECSWFEYDASKIEWED